MKILSVHKYYYDRDGASHYQLEVNRLLQLRGHEVIPFAMQSENNLKTPWSKFFVSPVQTERVTYGFQALRTVLRMFYSFEARDKMRRLIMETKPDVAHIHNIYGQISPSILDALAEAGVPTVMSVHDYHLISPNYMLWKDGKNVDMRRVGILRATLSRFHKRSFLASFAQASAFKFHQWLRFYDRNIARFVCPSDFTAQKLISAGYPKKNVRVIPHFIDTTNVKPVFDGDGSVLFVGRFVEEKGVRFILDLAKEMSETAFVLVGDGPLGEEVRACAKELGNVEVTGWLGREALAQTYARASVVIVPSLWQEVFGLVALEGMAYGKPVLVSDQGGLPEVVEDGVTGLVLPAGDLGDWEDALVQLLSNEKKRRAMGESARKRVENFYTPSRHLEALDRVFQEVR